MNYLNVEIIKLPLFLLQRQSNLFLLFTIIAVVATVVAIVLFVAAKNRNTKMRINNQNTANATTAEFKVIEEIIQTDSENIIM